MSATIPAEVLSDLHRLHGQLEDLRGRLERGPNQVRAHEANVAKLQTAAEAAHAAVKQTRMAADAKQLNLKASEDRIDNWKVKLNECGSNKEYQALGEQIAAAQMAGSVLADEILEALERIDTLTADAAEADKQLAHGKQELARMANYIEETADQLRSEIERIEGDVKAAEGRLAGDFKAEYLRIVRAKGAAGLSRVDDGVCTACGQQVTLNMRNTLAMSRPAYCQSCGAVLYVGGESS
jgi:predicted  nucleic acid-binding Zn-ribbon protein